MTEHGYQQYCALARTLDVVGDRWTLLIVRELRPGPRRFTDMVDGLPGISRKLLTDRLRDLERSDVIRRTQLPPPSARQVYELTDDGRHLASALDPLIAWGAKRIGERDPSEFFSPRWPGVAMAALANRDAATGVSETYQYVVGDVAFYLVVDDGSIEVHDGRAEDAAVVVTTDEQTWAQVAAGAITASSAVSAGTLTIAGDARARGRLARIFSREQMLGAVPARM